MHRRGRRLGLRDEVRCKIILETMMSTLPVLCIFGKTLTAPLKDEKRRPNGSSFARCAGRPSAATTDSKEIQESSSKCQNFLERIWAQFTYDRITKITQPIRRAYPKLFSYPMPKKPSIIATYSWLSNCRTDEISVPADKKLRLPVRLFDFI